MHGTRSAAAGVRERVGHAMTPPSPAIVCEDVSKVFGAVDGGVVAVRDATFTVGRGECFVIMGLSGSGKSTLVRCLTRLVEPTSGRIVIEGVDLLAASPAELIHLRRHVTGMVFQNFALLPHLTVIDNIAFPLAVQGVGEAERRNRASALVELVGLAGREASFPRELSGGQQQRVGIARALAVEPAILFLDEPFSALDPLIRREMQNEFLRLRQRLDKTFVFITHDFDEAIRLADRVAIMKDGAIVEIGTPEDLVVRPSHPYVAEFTRHVARAKVLRARTAARPLPPGAAPRTTVPAERRIAEVAETVLAAEAPVGVAEADGRLVGILGREDVVAALLDREAPP
jgi:glycine betaine/proline transport system ATP-binding protein